MRSSWLPFKLFIGVATVLCTAAITAHPLERTQTRFDVLITNGRIVDGTGASWFRGDVGIVGDRIAAIGSLADAHANVRVDATNQVVAPGFIDLLGQSEFNVLVDGRAASKILQGVTTEVTGEGSSIAPVNDRLIEEMVASAAHFGVAQDWRTLGDYFKRLEGRSHTTINVATFVGADGLRNYVIGKDDRPATAAELDRMKQLVAEAMQQGALGLSTSLQYVPDRFASTDEIVELATVEKTLTRLKDPATRERIKADMDDASATTWENQWYGANGGGPGLVADITVFDPATIRDVSTFDNPRHSSTGVTQVFVNGRSVVADGAITAERPGRPLRGPGYRAPGNAERAEHAEPDSLRSLPSLRSIVRH